MCIHVRVCFVCVCMRVFVCVYVFICTYRHLTFIVQFFLHDHHHYLILKPLIRTGMNFGQLLEHLRPPKITHEQFIDLKDRVEKLGKQVRSCVCARGWGEREVYEGGVG